MLPFHLPEYLFDIEFQRGQKMALNYQDQQGDALLY